MPVRDGGLGIRHVTSLALPAFVASAATASTLSLQADILADCAVLDSYFLHLYAPLGALVVSVRRCSRSIADKTALLGSTRSVG